MKILIAGAFAVGVENAEGATEIPKGPPRIESANHVQGVVEAVFWCRFIPFVRGVAAFPAGLSRMQKRFFVTYTAIGSAIFCFGLAYLGEVAGKNIDGIVAYVHDFALIIIAVVFVLAVGGFVWWRVAKARDPQSDVATRRRV